MNQWTNKNITNKSTKIIANIKEILKEWFYFFLRFSMPTHQNNIIIYYTEDGTASVSLYERDGNVWMNQSQLAELFDTSKQNISLHIQNIIKEWEMREEWVIKDYLTTASDGKDYTITFYSLQMIIAIWFRVKSKRWVQFRQWANTNLHEYMVKWFVIDDHRLKNPDGRLDYFDELLAKIRDIRTSEKRFYQKIRDLFTLNSDYDKNDKTTQLFFAQTQNEILYAITEKTAAEIVLDRADASSPTMWLTTRRWSRVRKQDITIAKNYLSEDEMTVSIVLWLSFWKRQNWEQKINKISP